MTQYQIQSETNFFSTQKICFYQRLKCLKKLLHKRFSWHFILFARTTFAWFTSKDEVTNRLTANADYGVSIVESFAPPENWLPGQEINKDVYAVNTGNVDAYVEETVSGLLTVTTEKATTELTADSVKLKAAEHYAVEAGAYLAYKPAASNLELGTMVVAMVPDSTDLNGYTTADAITDFTPDAAGLYVFRRSIGVDPETKIETFKYDGYYFDGQDYYKLSNLSVSGSSCKRSAHFWLGSKCTSC